MEDTNNTIFTHAKMEYTSQLIDNITPQIFDGLSSIYDESKAYQKVHSDKSIVIIFRTFLEKVPLWSNEIIETETERIIQMSNCDWLDDLITAVFISHTKILTSIGSNNNANIDLTIPKTINFIHKCYINIAREIWKNPYLFDDNLIGSDYQKNMRTIELIIKESIENTIRKLLPVKEILRQHLDTYETTNTEIRKRNNSNELRELLVNELRNLSIIPSQKEEEENNSSEDEEVEKEEVEKEDIGYVSPDEDEIKEKCDGLAINDIPDITEEKYDNVDIIDHQEDKIDKVKILSTFMDSLENEEENIKEVINEKLETPEVVLKEDNINDDNNNNNNNDDKVIDDKKEDFSIPGFDLLQRFNSNTVKEETEPVKEEKEPVKEEKEPVKEEVEPVKEEVEPEDNTIKVIKNSNDDNKNINDKEIISILKQDIPDDAQTIDNFFDDVSSLMEKKNISVDKTANKYTLFDDAIDE